ncbi:SOS response-associated peptidase [Xanthocytophaga agilis]|uniref:Abasic site processing protein n=1 Tax=Xanthocytophaga agilis TaxID=3048010 RepID=A0AAE3UC98_9BACT|nr:SOS response-associated peptidase [Xanthocytophaga agilis]MDJ1500713.1 SOS response-associated peptidase [Xanthocytophaga agilis]
MCGRYSIILEEESLTRAFHAQLSQDIPPHYNAAPGQSLPVITNEKTSQVQLFRWGFIPQWAKEENVGYKMINARLDGIEEKTSFKKAFQSQHCLVLANSFFEWKQSSSGKNGKTPYLIKPKDQSLFAMAGIWNRWTNYTTGEEISSFAIITTEANELMGSIHERMPVILSSEQAAGWINSSLSIDKQKALLTQYDSEQMEAYEVTREVNKAYNDYPQLLEPLGDSIRIQTGSVS